MNWLDIVVVLILGAVAAVECQRGFGRAVPDALCLYGALWVANTAAPSLSATVHLHSDPAANGAWVYGIMLAVCAAIALGISRFVYNSTQMDAGVFDRALGLAAGVAVGMMTAHGFVRVLAMGLAGEPSGAFFVADSFLGSEMLSFNTYHSILNVLTGYPSLHRDLPT